jgi:Sulfate permease family
LNGWSCDDSEVDIKKQYKKYCMEEFRLSNVRDDLLGGLVSVALAIPLAMGYGMFAFTTLGDSYFAHGALAGLYAAAAVGIVCVVLGDRSTTVYAPRVTTTFLLGALLYHLVHSDAGVLRGGNVHLIVLAFFSIILLGGVFQAIFGLVRLGSLIRFTPHPVMAGLQNAAAALLFLVQLGDVCGFDHSISFKAVFGHLAEVKPLSLTVALMTFIVMWKARVITTKIPPLLVGLGIGIMLYFALVLAGFGPQLGPIIGLPVAMESPTPYKAIGDLAQMRDFAELLPFIVGGALALAIVAAIDALLCTKLVTPPGASKVDGDRLLMRLGVGNVLSACFGGITSGINIGPSLANRAFGAKTSRSVLINADRADRTQMIPVRFFRQRSRRLSCICLRAALQLQLLTVVSLGANAADLNYPPPVFGQPQYGMAPPPAVAPPQVIIVPGPTVFPQYNNATVPPPPVGASPYGIAPPTAPRVDVAPRAGCPPTWSCGERGCGWQPGCVPPPERYSGQYESPGPVYPSSRSLGPQVYSTPDASPAPERFPRPYGSPHASILHSRCLARSRALSRSILATSLSRSNWSLFAIVRKSESLRRRKRGAGNSNGMLICSSFRKPWN